METKRFGRWLFRRTYGLPKSIKELKESEKVPHYFLKNVIIIGEGITNNSSNGYSFLIGDSEDQLDVRSSPLTIHNPDFFAPGDIPQYDNATWGRISSAKKGDRVDITLTRYGKGFHLDDLVKA